MFDAGLDEILRSKGIDLKKGLFFEGLGDPCQMKNLVHSFCSILQGGLIAAISPGMLDGEIFDPFEVARFSEKAADLDALLNEGFHQMTPNKSGSSCHQDFQPMPLYVNPLNFICFQGFVKENSDVFLAPVPLQ